MRRAGPWGRPPRPNPRSHPRHRVRLTGLQPDTLYHDRASQGGTTWTPDATFTTTVPADTGFRLAFLSDFQTSSSTPHAKITTRVLNVDQPQVSLLWRRASVEIRVG